MTTPAGCSTWASIADLPTEVAELHSPAEWAGFLAVATDVLWGATGRRWRGAGATATAVLRAAPPGDGGWPWHRSWGRCACYLGNDGGLPAWRPWSGVHTEPLAVRLPHPDATAVLDITLDHVPFAGTWTLQGPWLTRTDGPGWPACRDRVRITYTYGVDPPLGGRMACAELAAELGKAAAPDCGLECRLPARTRSISRQGISFEVVDSLDFLEKGLTGIAGIDLWIRAVNPSGRKQTGRVWSPDLERARRIS